MGLGSWLKTIGAIGGAIAAPFTGGTSLLGSKALLASLMGTAALGGALEGKKSSRTQTSGPTVSPEYQGIQDQLIKYYGGKLSSPTALPPGYETTGIQNINSIHNLIGQNLGNKLTSRGLSTSPVAGAAETQGELARAGDISRFSNEIPIREMEMRDRDASEAARFLNFGTGRETVYPGSALGSGLSSGAEMLAYLYGKGAFGGKGGPDISGSGSLPPLPPNAGIAIPPWLKPQPTFPVDWAGMGG